MRTLLRKGAGTALLSVRVAAGEILEVVVAGVWLQCRWYLLYDCETRSQVLGGCASVQTAIAGPAGAGRFEVIVTTNYDRLFEGALDTDGVSGPVCLQEDETLFGAVFLLENQLPAVFLCFPEEDVDGEGSAQQLGDAIRLELVPETLHFAVELLAHHEIEPLRGFSLFLGSCHFSLHRRSMIRRSLHP